jgi:hypothetical protein
MLGRLLDAKPTMASQRGRYLGERLGVHRLLSRNGSTTSSSSGALALYLAVQLPAELLPSGARRVIQAAESTGSTQFRRRANCRSVRYVGLLRATAGAEGHPPAREELRSRAPDVLIACVDGLTGFPEAIEAAFPLRWCANLGGTSDPGVDVVRHLQRSQGRCRGVATPLHRDTKMSIM